MSLAFLALDRQLHGPPGGRRMLLEQRPRYAPEEAGPRRMHTLHALAPHAASRHATPRHATPRWIDITQYRAEPCSVRVVCHGKVAYIAPVIPNHLSIHSSMTTTRVCAAAGHLGHRAVSIYYLLLTTADDLLTTYYLVTTYYLLLAATY